jgi:hypothetical protein
MIYLVGLFLALCLIALVYAFWQLARAERGLVAQRAAWRKHLATLDQLCSSLRKQAYGENHQNNGEHHNNAGEDNKLIRLALKPFRQHLLSFGDLKKLGKLAMLQFSNCRLLRRTTAASSSVPQFRLGDSRKVNHT